MLSLAHGITRSACGASFLHQELQRLLTRLEHRTLALRKRLYSVVDSLHDRSKESRVNGIVQDDPKFPMPQLWGHVLLHLPNHPEAKCAGGDGMRLLRHWQIHVTGLWIMGKEIQGEVLAGESFSEIEPEETLVYGCAKQNSASTKRTLDPMVIDRLKAKYSIKKLVKKTKLNRSVVRRAVRGESIQQRSWQLLMKIFESAA